MSTLPNTDVFDTITTNNVQDHSDDEPQSHQHRHMLPDVDIPHEDSSFELHSAISIEGWEGKPPTTKTGCRRMLQVPTHFEFIREADTSTDRQQQSVSAVAMSTLPMQPQTRLPRLPQLDSVWTPTAPPAREHPLSFEQIVLVTLEVHDTKRDPPRSPERCQYAGRRCNTPRAEKIGGSLHRFCQDHRLKANAAQRLSSNRRKQAAALSATGKALVRRPARGLHST
jgi:hypothetical protein